MRGRFFLFMSFSLFGVICLVAIVAGVFFTLTVNSQAAAQELTGTRIVYGLTFQPSGFDPHINASAELLIPLRSVYDTLLYRDPVTREIIPGLAESVNISADALTYTFTLRTGVKFHDGTDFNADAVVANIDRIINPATRSTKALSLLGPVESYRAVDPRTFEIKMRTPYAPLLDAFAQVYLGIASPTALAQYADDPVRYQYYQVGTGPYRFIEYLPNDRIVLQRNPEYAWGPTFYVTENPAPVEIVEFRFFQDEATRAPALETGAAQIMGELPAGDAQLLASDPSIALYPQPIPGLPLQFLFNTAQTPTDNVDLRRALIFATNRVAIIDAVFQQFSPAAVGPLAAASPYYSNAVAELYPYDPVQARELLLSLGYDDTDNDQYVDKDGQRLTLTMIVPQFGFAARVGQLIQSQWAEVGVELLLNQVAGSITVLEAAVNETAYHLVALNDFGIDANILNRFYLSDGRNNWMRYTSSDLDAFLLRALESPSDSERRALYEQIQVFIMDQALILPIRDYVNINGASAAVENLVYDAYGWSPLLWNIRYTPPEQ
jgi:peptide/nickel transport system substrate-binding protein